MPTPTNCNHDAHRLALKHERYEVCCGQLVQVHAEPTPSPANPQAPPAPAIDIMATPAHPQEEEQPE
jgi:hypothetical protein